MTKEEMINNLNADNKKEGRNSMGVSESFYNNYFLVKCFLEDKEIKAEDLSENELKLIIDLAEFAGDCFY